MFLHSYIQLFPPIRSHDYYSLALMTLVAAAHCEQCLFLFYQGLVIIVCKCDLAIQTLSGCRWTDWKRSKIRLLESLSDKQKAQMQQMSLCNSSVTPIEHTYCRV